MQDMKMLFSSRDRAQVERIREQLIAVGTRCEVRNYAVDDNVNGTCSYCELWVQANADYHTASIMYASPIQVLRQRSLDPLSGS